MAAAARLIRAKLSRLSLVFLNKSHTIVTLSSNGALRWRRLHFPPRKKLHWGIVLGTSGVLCGSVVLCSVSTGICLAYVNNNRFLVGLFGEISEYPLTCSLLFVLPTRQQWHDKASDPLRFCLCDYKSQMTQQSVSFTFCWRKWEQLQNTRPPCFP